MLKSLIIKELRESIWLVAVALGLYLLLLSGLMSRDEEGLLSYSMPTPQMALRLFSFSSQSNEVPFTGNNFTSTFMMISILFALGLGFQQSLKESRQGTYLFLLHRPRSRQAIFLTRMAVGAGLLLGCGMLPILIYACWASTPGNVPAPFEWSMTSSAWWHWASIPLVYLGAFLSGLRPAAWYGTRLLPLVFAFSILFVLREILWSWGLTAMGLAISYAVTYAALVSASLYVADSRDYS